MSRPTLVSVIIPAYEVEQFLTDAVRSVRQQTLKEVEIVVVDDGSSDGTAAVAARQAAEDSRVRLVRKKNGGLSSARNAGMEAARGEFLCFLDADDILLPDKLERQTAFLRAFPGCDLVYSDYYVGDASLTPKAYWSTMPPAIPLPELLAYCNWFAPLCPLIRRRLIDRVGAFDESLTSSEDWDYWIRASRCGVMSYLPGAVGVYRSHPGQMHRDRARMRLNQERVIRKHFQEGTPEARAALASIAWADAQRAMVERRWGALAVKMMQCAWRARSPRIISNVMQWGRYG